MSGPPPPPPEQDAGGPPRSTQPPSTQPPSGRPQARPQATAGGSNAHTGGSNAAGSSGAASSSQPSTARESDVKIDLTTRERPEIGEMVLMKENMRDKTVKRYMQSMAFLFGAVAPDRQDAQEARKRALQQKYAGKWMYKTFAKGKEKKVRKIAEMNYDKRWIRTGFFQMKGKAGMLKKTAQARRQNIEMAPTTHQAQDAPGQQRTRRPQPSTGGSDQDTLESPRGETAAMVKKPVKQQQQQPPMEDDDWDDDEDDEDQEYFPWFIVSLTIAQLIVLGLEIWDSGGIEPFPENPFLGVKQKTLLDMGAKSVPKILDEGEGWRLISPIILHAGIIHYALNMTFQLRYGLVLEKMYGWFRIAILYLTCGLAGNLLSAIFLPDHLTVGASSALYGLLGCLLTEVLQNWDRLESPVSALIQVIATIVVSLILGLLPQVDNFAHIGGMFVGIFAAMTVLPTVTFGKWTTTRKAFLALIGFFIVAAYMVVAFGILYGRREPRAWCGWCDLINCVPIKESWCDSVSPTGHAPPPPPPTLL